MVLASGRRKMYLRAILKGRTGSASECLRTLAMAWRRWRGRVKQLPEDTFEICASRPSHTWIGVRRTSPKGTMTIPSGLYRIDQFQNERISVSGRTVFVLYDLGQGEHLRTDFQASTFRRKQVDFKMKLIFFHRQVYDSAQHSESLGFANRQSA